MEEKPKSPKRAKRGGSEGWWAVRRAGHKEVKETELREGRVRRAFTPLQRPHGAWGDPSCLVCLRPCHWFIQHLLDFLIPLSVDSTRMSAGSRDAC